VPGVAPLEALEVLKAIDVLAVEPAVAPAVELAVKVAAPAPPPDAPPPEEAPPDPAFAAPAIGDAFVGALLPPVEDSAEAADQDGIQSVTIDREWRGGDNGLAALRDLPSIVSLSFQDASLTDASLPHVAALSKLQSLSIQSTPFTTAALVRFREQRPSVRILARGTAMLGVSAEITGPCILNSVFEGTAAAEVGLKVGDEITDVAELRIRDFSDLTIAVFSHQPGDKLAVTFKRDGTAQTVQVALKERKAL